jgi:hypothetical protein
LRPSAPRAVRGERVPRPAARPLDDHRRLRWHTQGVSGRNGARNH